MRSWLGPVGVLGVFLSACTLLLDPLEELGGRGDGDADGDGDMDSDGDGDVDSDTDSDTDIDGDGDVDSDGDIDGDGDADLDQDCVPECVGRQCGDDGCGGTCPPGCTPPDECNAEGRCFCEPQCDDRECGPDGCGEQCGFCDSPAICDEGAGQCVLNCAINAGFGAACDGTSFRCDDGSRCVSYANWSDIGYFCSAECGGGTLCPDVADGIESCDLYIHEGRREISLCAIRCDHDWQCPCGLICRDWLCYP